MKLIALTALAYSSGILPTVTIKTENGPVRINEEDFDPETMALYDAVEPDPVPAEPAATETVPAPADPAATNPDPAPAQKLLVMKSGAKFFIVNELGAKIDGEAAEALGIVVDGYQTEAKAKAALAEITAKQA
jgi:hypothetical protein